MKQRAFIVILLLCAAIARAEDAVQVPEGIRYKEASAKVNDDAKELLRKRFTDKATDADVAAMFDSMLICGPGLWRDLKSDESLAALPKGRVSFEVPVLGPDGKPTRTEKHEGKLFQSSDEVLLFWKAFIKRTDFSDLKIRKLNPEELRIFWAMISFDITEPLFILESGKHKLLVVFTAADHLKIAWIDDYQNVTLKQEKPEKKKE
jgi:hypothetical protein